MQREPQEPSADREALVGFLSSRRVMSLASAEPSGSYSAPLYYVSTPDASTLIFLSDPASRHGRNLATDPRASAAIYREADDVRELLGVQLLGRVRLLERAEEGPARALYLQRFPEAKPILAARSTARFYRFELDWAKLTDNSRGFGHKDIFQLRPPPEGEREAPRPD